MAEFSRLVITNNGQALLAKIIAGTGSIEFTKICTCATQYAESQLAALTSISDIKQESLVSKVTRTNDVTIKVEAAFTNTELTEGYYMRTLGLYAVDPDVGEILYAVTIESSGNCYMPPYNGATVSGAYVQLVTTVGNAENVSLIVDAAAVATIGDIQDLQEQFTSHLDDTSNPHNVTPAQIGAAASSHTHSASDVTSGTLPIARGGTGATTAADARINLGLSNENLLFNILPLASDVSTNISANPQTVAKVDLLHFGSASWILRLSSTNTGWKIMVGDIDDENYPGCCKRYIAYQKPAGTGGNIYGLYQIVKNCTGNVFKAGTYTLSFYIYCSGDASKISPQLLTDVPTSVFNNHMIAVSKGVWTKITKSFTISADTSVLYVLLDNFAPSQDASRYFKFADIKLEYGSRATDFNPDYTKELILNALASS